MKEAEDLQAKYVELQQKLKVSEAKGDAHAKEVARLEKALEKRDAEYDSLSEGYRQAAGRAAAHVKEKK
eukprot:4803074-Pleurochrysis_carterae.AAC.1